ncbi:MAG: PEP-CTERM sorting domain-containing protein [Candidatus Zixiibacteriota bacterium]
MSSRIKPLFCLVIGLIALMAVPGFGYSATQNIFYDWTFDSGIQYAWNGDNHTYDYASYIDFYEGPFADGAFGGAWLGTSSFLQSSMHWSHLLPNLSAPGTNVTSAKLFIDAAWVDAGNNLVSIEGTWDWDALNHTFLDNTTYNIGAIDDPSFWDDGALDISVFAGEHSLRVDRAILMLDYEEGNGSGSAEVPEPASVILFGAGLVGFGALLRCKRS